MSIRKASLAFAAFVMAVSVTSAWADGLVARTNTATLAQGDTLQLMLTADGSVQAAPDLTPLLKDFEVVGTSQSSQTQIINGKQSQSISWIVTLSPLAQGMLTIPTLRAGSFSSDPLSVEVVDASQLPSVQGADDISLSATIDDGLYYRFQEIPLTLRIETSQPVQSAQVIEPVGDFELSANGQSRQSQISRDGQLINVVEQAYLLRPQIEGELEIAPFTLKGTVQDPDARSSDPFASAFGGSGSFARMEQMMAQFGGGAFGGSISSIFGPQGKSFVARSEALNLEVEASPAGDSTNWFLPAKQVQLRGEWLDENPEFREGEAVSRRISVLALGARPEQLPDLTFEDADGARVYVDDVQTDTANTAEGTVAQREFFISVVPTKAGEVTLPEINLEWLNTVTGESQVATLAAETLMVESDTSAETIAGTDSVENTIDSTDSTQDSPALDNRTTSTQWALVGMGVFVIAFGLAAWLFRRRKAGNADATDNESTLGVRRTERQATVNQLTNTLRKAARRGDIDTVYRTLLSLRQHADKSVSPDVESAIAVIERSSYAQGVSGNQPEFHELLRRLEHNKFQAKAPRDTPVRLPPLYPSLS